MPTVLPPEWDAMSDKEQTIWYLESLIAKVEGMTAELRAARGGDPPMATSLVDLAPSAATATPSDALVVPHNCLAAVALASSSTTNAVCAARNSKCVGSSTAPAPPAVIEEVHDITAEENQVVAIEAQTAAITLDVKLATTAPSYHVHDDSHEVGTSDAPLLSLATHPPESVLLIAPSTLSPQLDVIHRSDRLVHPRCSREYLIHGDNRMLLMLAPSSLSLTHALPSTAYFDPAGPLLHRMSTAGAWDSVHLVFESKGTLLQQLFCSMQQPWPPPIQVQIVELGVVLFHGIPHGYFTDHFGYEWWPLDHQPRMKNEFPWTFREHPFLISQVHGKGLTSSYRFVNLFNIGDLVYNTWGRWLGLLGNCIRIRPGQLLCLWFLKQDNDDSGFSTQLFPEGKQWLLELCTCYITTAPGQHHFCLATMDAHQFQSMHKMGALSTKHSSSAFLQFMQSGPYELVCCREISCPLFSTLDLCMETNPLNIFMLPCKKLLDTGYLQYYMVYGETNSKMLQPSHIQCVSCYFGVGVAQAYVKQKEADAAVVYMWEHRKRTHQDWELLLCFQRPPDPASTWECMISRSFHWGQTFLPQEVISPMQSSNEFHAQVQQAAGTPMFSVSIELQSYEGTKLRPRPWPLFDINQETMLWKLQWTSVSEGANSNDECHPKCDSQIDFVKNLKGTTQILEKKGYTQFTPHSITWPCTESYTLSKQSKSQCINHGGYCTPDLEQDFSSMTDFATWRPMKQHKYTKECAGGVIRSRGLNHKAKDQCIGDPDVEVNPVLKGAQDPQIDKGPHGECPIVTIVKSVANGCEGDGIHKCEGIDECKERTAWQSKECNYRKQQTDKKWSFSTFAVGNHVCLKLRPHLQTSVATLGTSNISLHRLHGLQSTQASSTCFNQGRFQEGMGVITVTAVFAEGSVDHEYYLSFDHGCDDKGYFFDLVSFDHNNYFSLVEAYPDSDQGQEHRVQWDPGGFRWRQHGVKPHFKDGGMSGTFPSPHIYLGWPLGDHMGRAWLHRRPLRATSTGRGSNEEPIQWINETGGGGYLLPLPPPSLILVSCDCNP